MIDRALLVENLLRAERQVAQGARRLALAQQMIAKLESDGGRTTVSNDMLTQFREAQAVYVAHRDRLRKELLGQAQM
jgi:hypothetical protein